MIEKERQDWTMNTAGVEAAMASTVSRPWPAASAGRDLVPAGTEG